MSEYPDAGYPDMEKLVASHIRPLVGHDAHIGNFVILDYDDQVEDHDSPFITVRYRGGVIDSDDFTWYVNIEVSCWGKSRPVAQGTSFAAARLLFGCAGEGIGDVGIDGVEDVTGPEELTVSTPDDRCMTRIYQLAVRPQYQL